MQKTTLYISLAHQIFRVIPERTWNIVAGVDMVASFRVNYVSCIGRNLNGAHNKLLQNA